MFVKWMENFGNKGKCHTLFAYLSAVFDCLLGESLLGFDDGHDAYGFDYNPIELISSFNKQYQIENSN